MNANKIIRLGTEHAADSLTLSQFAFQYVIAKEELEDAKLHFLSEPADIWGALVDDKLAAQVTVLQLHTYIAGRKFAMGGVAGVSTWPEYRRQGLVARILVHSLREMKDKGLTISFLAPFSFSFYRKFGWEAYTEHKEYTLQTSQLPPRTPYSGRFERCGDYRLLHDIYEQYAAQFNGTLVRTEQWWQHRISRRKPGQIVVYRNVDGDARGYMIYEAANRKLQVHELVYLDEEARQAAWTFIAQHDSMVESVKVTAPMDDLLPDTLPEPRIKQEIIPYFMARIVDAEAFIAEYPFEADGQSDKLMLQISDEHAPWNEGAYELIIEESGQARLERLQRSLNDEEGISLDIGALSALLTGYRSASQLSCSKRIHGDRETMNRLHKRIPERTTYLMDFF